MDLFSNPQSVQHELDQIEELLGEPCLPTDWSRLDAALSGPFRNPSFVEMIVATNPIEKSKLVKHFLEKWSK